MYAPLKPSAPAHTIVSLHCYILSDRECVFQISGDQRLGRPTFELEHSAKNVNMNIRIHFPGPGSSFQLHHGSRLTAGGCLSLGLRGGMAHSHSH